MRTGIIQVETRHALSLHTKEIPQKINCTSQCNYAIFYIERLIKRFRFAGSKISVNFRVIIITIQH